MLGSIYYKWEYFILKWSRLILLVFYILSLKYKPSIHIESRNNLDRTLQGHLSNPLLQLLKDLAHEVLNIPKNGNFRTFLHNLYQN